MSAEEQLTAEQRTEVEQWTALLLNSIGEQRQQAASELSRIGVWTRGNIRPRGTLRVAAENRLPSQNRLQDLVQVFLQETDAGPRGQLALALGEWGDQNAAKALRDVLCSGLANDATVDEETQLACIMGLRIIGGSEAKEGIINALNDGTERVRDAAILAIEELATGGRLEDTESPLYFRSAEVSDDASKQEGSRVLSRRRIHKSAGKDTEGRVVSALRKIRADHTVSEYLRLRTGDVLTFFGE